MVAEIREMRVCDANYVYIMLILCGFVVLGALESGCGGGVGVFFGVDGCVCDH
jgi:hypothetical protein